MKGLLALIAGALLPFAFAPYGYYFLAIISLAILFSLWQKASPREAFGLGFIYGLACFGFGVYWVYISIHDFGNSNVVIAGLITSGFISILALFPALNGYLCQRFCTYSPLTFAASWALIEWVRSWIFTGFPWLLLGQSQTDSPLRGFVPIVGVYGVSFLMALSGGLLFSFSPCGRRWRVAPDEGKLENLSKPLIRPYGAPSPARGEGEYILKGGILILIWLTGFGLSHIHWTHPSGKPMSVVLVQGNIPQSLKWSPDQALSSLALYENLTEQHLPPAGGLVIWPETAITLLLADAKPWLEDLRHMASLSNNNIITGIPIKKSNNYYNGAIVIGAGQGEYTKRHLVPFGEYTPLKSLLGKLLDILKLPMSDFVPGPQRQALININNYYISTYICYEIAYSDLLHTDLPQANLLITISNDSWFGQSSALGQQRQLAQFAAQITGRYMLVAANSGETVVINPAGRIIAALPIAKTAVLESAVVPMTGSTPWIKLGNLPFIILFALILGILRKP